MWEDVGSTPTDGLIDRLSNNGRIAHIFIIMETKKITKEDVDKAYDKAYDKAWKAYSKAWALQRKFDEQEKEE